MNYSKLIFTILVIGNTFNTFAANDYYDSSKREITVSFAKPVEHVSVHITGEKLLGGCVKNNTIVRSMRKVPATNYSHTETNSYGINGQIGKSLGHVII